MSEPEIDPLASLEARIERAVDLITQLRAERDGAVVEMAKWSEEVNRLKGEVDSLTAERKTVRTRIEKLLGQMDLMAQG